MLLATVIVFFTEITATSTLSLLPLFLGARDIPTRLEQLGHHLCLFCFIDHMVVVLEEDTQTEEVSFWSFCVRFRFFVSIFGCLVSVFLSFVSIFGYLMSTLILLCQIWAVFCVSNKKYEQSLCTEILAHWPGWSVQ